jgi:glycosyltransferase involved in cell wall biosynthesis
VSDPSVRRQCELSIVIPVRDNEATLAAQLDALLAQEWDGEWEVVVVDNKSTDGSMRVVESYRERHPRLRVVTAARGDGCGYARNAGIAETDSPLLGFCDGDDIVAEGWLAAMGDGLRRHDIVTGPLELDRLNPPRLAASRGRSTERAPGSFFEIFRYAAGGNSGLRRAVWEQLGGYAEHLGWSEDIELSMRAWMAGYEVAFVPELVVHYRYRHETGVLWRQAKAAGAMRPLLWKLLRERGLPTPPRLAGWRSWVWMVLRAPTVVSRSRRPAWLWVAGNRWGQLVGCVRARTVFL